MNRPNYFNVIEERLNLLALRINKRGQLNILDFHGHSEYFYQYFLNEVYGWTATNENDNKQNVEAIDLIDHTNKFVIQVSATASKQKIESSLSKNSIKNYKGYAFKFVSIARDADDLRNKTFDNPHEISFTPSTDIIDIVSILSTIRGLHPDDLKRVYEFVKKELIPEIDPFKLETNLAKVITILSKENWNKKEAVTEINSFEIDRKISFNNLNSAKGIIDDYYLHFGRVDKIYSEFDTQGLNKSSTVLSAFKDEYLRAKTILSDDALFFKVIDEMILRVMNSSNYSSIPLEELEQCIKILTVDAFIRCKIFENPHNYNYATT
jgi:hypothetical protein